MNRMKNVSMILILFSFSFLGVFTVLSSAQYSINLYVKNPLDTSGTLLTQCTSTVSSFTCSYGYSNCSQIGIYSGDAQTYNAATLLSDSGYNTLYQVGCLGTSSSCSSLTGTNCQNQQGCSWVTSVCQGTATPCTSLDYTCINSINKVQQGCTPGNFNFCGSGGTTIVNMNPDFVFQGENVSVTINITDPRYFSGHTIYFNLTIDGVTWTNQDCSIANINLTSPGTCGGGNCRDWNQGTDYAISTDGSFSIKSTCRIPTSFVGGVHILTVVPTAYSNPVQLSSGTTNFNIQNNQNISMSLLHSFLKLFGLAK